MWKLHRYYLRELSVNAAITFLVVFAIVLLSLMARGIQRAQGGSVFDAVLITLLWALDAFPHLLTIAFLMATVLTFARAAQDREMVAIRSAGIAPHVPMMAPLLLGAMLTVFGSFCMHYVLPEIHFRKYHIGAEVMRNLILTMKLSGNHIHIPGTDKELTFKGRDAAKDYLDCTLFDPKKGTSGLGSVIHVDKVAMPRPDEHSNVLTLELYGLQDPIQNTFFKGPTVITLPLSSYTDQNRRNDSDADLTSDQLLSEVLRGVHNAPEGALYTLHRRTCYAFMPLLLAPIGFCIALLARDRGRAMALVIGLVPLVVFYVADVLSAKILRATDWPPIGWLPAALLLVLGAPFCWRTLRL